MLTDRDEVETESEVWPARQVVAIVVLVLLLGLAVRIFGIAKEPFWLDEIITFQFTSLDFADLGEKTAKDSHPPLYFFGLKLWRILAGSSEVSLRAFSAAWSVFGLLVVIVLARNVAHSWWVGISAGFLLAINPLDIYYAQEARMYSQVAALGSLSTWCLWRWMAVEKTRNDWLWPGCYLASAVLVLYSHYIGVAVLLAQGLFVLPWFIFRRRLKEALIYIGSAVMTGIFFLPWFCYVVELRSTFYNPLMAWLQLPKLRDPVDLLLRDLFWGRAGLSTIAWQIAALLSLCALVFLGIRLVQLRHRCGRRSPSPSAFLIWMVGAPVAVAVVLSFAYEPVFYRLRFCLLVLPPFISLVAVGCVGFGSKRTRASLLAVFVVLFCTASVLQHRAYNKAGMREFINVWQIEGPPDHVFFFPRWNRRVAGYYFGSDPPVPTRRQLERKLRSDEPLTIWVCTNVAYEHHEKSGEKALFDWVMSLGSVNRQAEVDRMRVVELKTEPLEKEFPLYEVGTPVEFGTNAADPHLWFGWSGPEKTFRWSNRTKAVFLFRLDDPGAATLALEMFCHRQQQITIELNDTVLDDFECGQRAPHQRKWRIPDGVLGEENTLVFFLPDAIAPADGSDSKDKRKLALGVKWLRIDSAR